SALLKKASDGDTNATTSASRVHVAGNVYGETEGLHPSSWSFAEKQRPASTQYKRASRWLAKSFGSGPENNSSGTGADRREIIALPQSQSRDDVAAMSASPQSAKSISFSAKLNLKLGKLKRSLKPTTPETTI
ncbi:hypothetical protein FB639_003302, partial [Coemansia asiatica]